MLRKLSVVLVLFLLIVALVVWRGSRERPVLPDPPQNIVPAPAIHSDSLPVTRRPGGATVPDADGDMIPARNQGKLQHAGDAVAGDYQVPAVTADLPPELSALLGTIMKEVAAGNYDYAALIALDAEELSADYPQVQLLLHSSIAVNYEKLGYLDMAIEQYRKAFALDPQHVYTLKALRRLDPQFAAAHPESDSPEAEVGVK